VVELHSERWFDLYLDLEGIVLVACACASPPVACFTHNKYDALKIEYNDLMGGVMEYKRLYG
jgi:hypothetical protein